MDFYSFKQWEGTTESKNLDWNNYGLKSFVLLRYRFRFICKEYTMECDLVYMDKHYKMSNTHADVPSSPTQATEMPSFEDIAASSPTDAIVMDNNDGDAANNLIDNIIYHATKDLSSNNHEECWSEKLGYSCCTGCEVYKVDSNGEWGYELNEWCDILPLNCKN